MSFFFFLVSEHYETANSRVYSFIKIFFPLFLLVGS